MRPDRLQNCKSIVHVACHCHLVALEDSFDIVFLFVAKIILLVFSQGRDNIGVLIGVAFKQSLVCVDELREDWMWAGPLMSGVLWVLYVHL